MLTVRALGPDEGRVYLEIVSRAIRGLAADHYSADVLAGWIVPVTDDTVRDLMVNRDREIRLIAAAVWMEKTL